MRFARLTMLKKTISHLLSNLPAEINKRDAEIILAHLLGKNQTFILAHPESQVSFFTAQKFHALLKKRMTGWPLAYLTGHKEFFGLDFLVNESTLIPRPETEVLVEAAIEEIKKNKANTILIDVGTGTGCIPIAIIKNLPANTIIGYALDISEKALKTAQKNAALLQAPIELLPSNLLTDFPIHFLASTEQIIITANLPYLTAEEFKEEPSIQHEPYQALVAKENGLALYFTLLTQIKNIPEKKNRVITLFCEINPHQVGALRQSISTIFPDAHFLVLRDLAGLDRVLSVSWTG